jgi:hypothetical protein
MYRLFPRAGARFPAWIALAGLLAMATPAVSQPAGCDEGVIRLPDRSGTIQICSALAARVPELARQLSQATAALGSQQAQIAELTRLVRGLNNVSRNIGLERQAKMMQSLSSELQGAGGARSSDALTQINERLDGLQASLLGALSDPKMAAALGDALKGPVGEAIARLDLGGASRQIDDISERLKALQSSVGQVQADTSAIRQQLAQMDQRQQAAEGARQERETVTIDLLKRLSGQVRELGQRGGLIDNARTFAEHYHNARILAQRGETDLALASYRAVFQSGVQMADPVIDLVTLLTRQYGRRGAGEALKRDFEKQLPTLSYLYGLQLLADRELDEVEALLFKEPQRVSEFPPLAALSIRRLHERMARESRGQAPRITAVTFFWSDASGLAAVAERLDKEIQSGNYLAFYIDPIRASRELDDFRAISDNFTRKQLLKVKVWQLAYTDNFPRQSVDLMRSPVVLDYTYLLDPPSRQALATLSRDAGFWPQYKPGSIRLSIWDAADVEKPIQVCSGPANRMQCKNLNTPEFRCKSRLNPRIEECLSHYPPSRDDREELFSPRVEARLIAQETLGAACISRLRYTDRTGREVVIDARDLIAVSLRAPDDELRRILGSCGYDLQNLPPSAEASRPAGSVASATVAAYADAVQSDRPVTYNAENCERVGYRGNWVYSTPTLAARQLDRFLLKLAQTLKTLPHLPQAQEAGFQGYFDEADKQCKLRVLANGQPYACTVARLVTNRWLPAPALASSNTSRMLDTGEVWNGGIYPDLAAPVRCVAQEKPPTPEAATPGQGVALGRLPGGHNRPVPTPRLASTLQLLESEGIEHELEALGAGHGPRCDTKGYSGATYRIRVDLGLRALQQGLCPLKETPRKALIESALKAHAPRVQGCFTSAGMTSYQRKTQEWLASAAKDCAGPGGKQVQEFMQAASEWALERP